MIRLRICRIGCVVSLCAAAALLRPTLSLAADETTAKAAAPVASAAVAPAAVASAAADPARADFYDVIFFAEARPIFIRVRIETSQQRLADAWRANVSEEFKFLDRDKNGALDAAELARAADSTQRKPNDSSLIQSIGSVLGIGKTVAVTTEPGGLAARLRQSQPEFQLNVSSNGGGGADRLFVSLDANGDGQISAEEQAAGLDRLTARDLDDDELLSLQELAAQPYPTLNFNNGFLVSSGEQAGGSSIRRDRFVTLSTQLDRQECAERWIADYGKQDQLRIAADSPLAARLKPSAAGAAGAPLGIVTADATALAEALKNPPIDMELLVRLGKKSDKELPRVAFVTPDGTVLPKDVPGIKFSSKNGARLFETAAERVEFVASTDNGGDNQKEQYQRNFKQADQDLNKYVDKKEAEQYGNFGGRFEVIDVNGDEKIFEDEFNAWLDRQLASAASRAVLSANDQGRPFFPSFDTNDDGRLGWRELRTGLKNLMSRDANGDHQLSDKELVHLYRLSVGPGQFNLFQSYGVFSYSTESDARAKPTKGPEWFRNMDRNQDGDVSRKEFLGSAENFSALDRDGDGLIDAKEAEIKPK